MIREEDVKEDAEFVVNRSGANASGMEEGTVVNVTRDGLDGDGDLRVFCPDEDDWHYLKLQHVDYPLGDRRRAGMTLASG